MLFGTLNDDRTLNLEFLDPILIIFWNITWHHLLLLCGVSVASLRIWYVSSKGSIFVAVKHSSNIAPISISISLEEVKLNLQTKLSD